MKFGFLPALTLLFIALKLTHYIDWSWWYITAPSWGIITLIFGVWFTCKVLMFLCELGLRIGETEEDTKKRHNNEKLVSSLNKLSKSLKR